MMVEYQEIEKLSSEAGITWANKEVLSRQSRLYKDPRQLIAKHVLLIFFREAKKAGVDFNFRFLFFDGRGVKPKNNILSQLVKMEKQFREKGSDIPDKKWWAYFKNNLDSIRPYITFWGK